MRYLGQEIADPPTGCANRNRCIAVTERVEELAEATIAINQELMPDTPAAAATDIEAGIIVSRAIAFANHLPAAAEEAMPSAQRCAGCVITCAMGVMRDSGAV